MKKTNLELRVLIQKSAQDDTESCRQLYELVVDKVYAYIHHRTNAEEVAVDLTQDTLSDLFTALRNFSYQSDAQFYAFVFVITKRMLAKHYNSINSDKTPETISETDVIADPINPTTRKEDGHDVRLAIEALDEVAREIVVLRHWSQYSFGEIASLLEMNENAVRVRHHRALTTLAANLNT